MVDERLRHRAYTRAVGDDPPDVRNWIWPTRAGSGQGQAAISRNGAHT
jgi:xylulose-5-phosphate/fructose-6-phosphate phosphoketolase